jgi:hypothetical protein
LGLPIEQCSDTKLRGAKLRGATRSAGSGRMNTAEINGSLMKKQFLYMQADAVLPKTVDREIFIYFLPQPANK